MDIREIENIIDNLHDGHSAFSGTKEQLTYELLSVFEDLCSIVVMDNIGVRPQCWELSVNLRTLNRFTCSLKIK